MRGRLIQKFYARIARRDTQNTVYDDLFRETKRAAGGGMPTGASQRAEHATEDVPVQVAPKDMEMLEMVASGNDPKDEIILTAHYRQLRNLGLVESDGRSSITNGARIVSLLDKTKSVMLSFADLPIYIIKLEPRGWGLNMAMPKRNLLNIHVDTRLREDAG